MIWQVLSPHNLEMDSDTSSVAAWSFSMATPTTAPQGRADKAGGSCSCANLSLMSAATTTTVDEDSVAMSEDEEGTSSADEGVLGNQKSDHCKTVLKIKDKVLMKNKVPYANLYKSIIIGIRNVLHMCLKAICTKYFFEHC